MGFLATFFVCLGLGQLIAGWQGWPGASLVGRRRGLAYALGLGLLGLGLGLMPTSWESVGWAVLAGPVAVRVLLWGGSSLFPPPHPNRLFEGKPPHFERVSIPHRGEAMPGVLLRPRYRPATGKAVCLVHGAGDTKISYKWRLVQALLDAGLTVLSIDLPGHGDYRHKPLVYPACLSAIPAAIHFLRAQPDIKHVGLIGISLGGAVAMKAMVECGQPWPEALVIFATPTRVNFTRWLFYGEAWRALRAPVLSILGEASIKQLRENWQLGGYQSPHRVGELFRLLAPVESLRQVQAVPTLLIYGGRDSVSPPAAARTMHQAAPQATLYTYPGASHVTLILMNRVAEDIAAWLGERLGKIY